MVSNSIFAIKKDQDSLIDHFAAIRKCLSDYGCKIHKALLIKKYPQKLIKKQLNVRKNLR